MKAPALWSGGLAGSPAAAGEPSQIPGETSEEERASANTQALLSSREAPEVDLRPAGSGLVEVLLDCASFPQPRVLTSGAPRGGHGIREHKEGTRLAGSPEAVPAQRQRRSLARAPLHGRCQVPDAPCVAVGGADFVPLLSGSSSSLAKGSRTRTSRCFLPGCARTVSRLQATCGQTEWKCFLISVVPITGIAT